MGMAQLVSHVLVSNMQATRRKTYFQRSILFAKAMILLMSVKQATD
jgi:hypothetical protein